ncbi:xanthine dehydrogenase family protein molybdopterin-binding subunit [Rubrimonas sp.]|uniref:xanthine dehydrogenase family protein molybdopterin-binding subunit n=1 Tax=Rubrimonas sp. TaxID=2036015 RepID=UPI002FDCF95E
MMKFGVGQSVARVEDVRLLRGAGRYIEDVSVPGEARAAFLRSPVAHADIAALDVSAARAAPGVIAVITGEDLDAGIVNDMDATRLRGRDGALCARPRRPVLAVDRVRHVGEAVALVVAETLAQARDAVELIAVDFDERDNVTDTAAALDPGASPLHDEAPGNLCYDWAMGDEAATDAAFAAAAHRVALDLVNNRVIANPLETRGVLAEWDGARLHLRANGQGPWDLKAELADKLGLKPDQVRVSTPDVGGGFGMKAITYPEQIAVAYAAMTTGRPVKWIAERGEGMASDAAGRDHVTSAEAAFDADYRLTALRVRSIAAMGAYLSGFGAFIPSVLVSKVLPGVYDVQTYFFGVKGVFTNTVPTDAYRGAGRPEAIYVIERLMDYAARALGLDPVDLRRRNFIRSFPYVSCTGETYDVGDFDRVLDCALAEADVAGFPARKAESARAGRLRGLGLAYYIESILGDQNETTKIAFAEDGGIDLFVGTQSNGQGHETVFAQFLTDRLGVPFDAVRLVQGDTDRVAQGGGTGGSRSVTMQGSSIRGAADAWVARALPFAADELEAGPEDVEFVDGAFRIVGADAALPVMEVVARARAKGRADLLAEERETVVPGRSFPNGCHICEVEIEPETGGVSVLRYSVVDDFGVLMNPMLAEGQVHGGVVQGLGQALAETVVHDAEGQLLTASFMDYHMPRAGDAPMIAFRHEGTPSTANAIGMKGCGEAGTVGALAAVVNAALDAVWDDGVRHVDMPLTPLRVWSWLDAARAARADAA